MFVIISKIDDFTLIRLETEREKKHECVTLERFFMSWRCGRKVLD